MSEFSESYHLRSDNADDAKELLKRSRLTGCVFPAKSGWVTFVVEGGSFSPNESLVQANVGTLVYYSYGEDHGWDFSIYHGPEQVCYYQCTWEDKIEVVDDQLDLDRVHELNKSRLDRADQADLKPLGALLHPSNFDEIMDSPAYRFAEILGLPHYKWLSCYYVELSGEKGEGLYDDAIRVS